MNSRMGFYPISTDGYNPFPIFALAEQVTIESTSAEEIADLKHLGGLFSLLEGIVHLLDR